MKNLAFLAIGMFLVQMAAAQDQPANNMEILVEKLKGRQEGPCRDKYGSHRIRSKGILAHVRERSGGSNGTQQEVSCPD